MIINTRPFWKTLALARKVRASLTVAVIDQQDARVRDMLEQCGVPLNADTCRAAIVGAVTVMCGMNTALDACDNVDNTPGSPYDLTAARTLIATAASLIVTDHGQEDVAA